MAFVHDLPTWLVGFATVAVFVVGSLPAGTIASSAALRVARARR
jgi:hypothetical protein